jgi:formate-dependent nitrite reductase membrane component NrfD
VKVLRKNEREDETQFTTKIDVFLSFTHCWMLMYFFAGLKINKSHPVYDQT